MSQIVTWLRLTGCIEIQCDETWGRTFHCCWISRCSPSSDWYLSKDAVTYHASDHRTISKITRWGDNLCVKVAADFIVHMEKSKSSRRKVKTSFQCQNLNMQSEAKAASLCWFNISQSLDAQMGWGFRSSSFSLSHLLRCYVKKTNWMQMMVY